MKDFLITPSGDLVFTESSKENKPLEITFYLSQSHALKINYEVDTYQVDTPRNNSLLINFNFDNVKNNKKAMTVSNDAYVSQQIMMRLKTSLTELPERPEIGSMLETVMHKNINDKSVQNIVAQVVGSAVKDLLNNPAIKVIPYVDHNNGYNQIMKVMIYENDELVLVYEVEG